MLVHHETIVATTSYAGWFAALGAVWIPILGYKIRQWFNRRSRAKEA